MTFAIDKIRFSLALLAISLSAAIPYFASQQQMTLLLLLISGIGVCCLILFNPYLGFAALIIGSQLVPFEIGTGTQTGINPAILMTVILFSVWLFELVVIKQRLAFILSRTYLPLFALLVSAFLSFLVGQLPFFPMQSAPMQAQLGGLSIFVFSILIFLVTAHQIKDILWLERLCWVFVGMGLFYMFGYHYSLAVSPAIYQWLTPVFRQGAAGSILWVWLTVIPLSQLLINKRLRLIPKLLLITLLIAIVHIRFIESRGWTSGWLPAFIGVSVLLIIRARRSIIILGLLATVVAALSIDKFTQMILEGNTFSYTSRLEAWRLLLNMLKDSLVFGLGPANYYWYTPMVSILGFNVNFSSHNNYIDLIMQTGVLGVVLFLWFFISITILALRMVDRVPDGFVNAYIYGCIGGIAGTLAAGFLGDWVLPFVYNIGLSGFRSSVFTWFFLGGLMAIEFQLFRKQNEPAPTIQSFQGARE